MLDIYITVISDNRAKVPNHLLGSPKYESLTHFSANVDGRDTSYLYD